MNRAIAALHGRFGRACLYSQSRSMATHAHREGHLIFYLDGQLPTFRVGARTCVGDARTAIAVNPFEPHDVSYRRDDADCLLLLLYIDPGWFLEIGHGDEAALRFGRVDIEVTPPLGALVEGVTELLAGGGGEAPPCFDERLHALTAACHEGSWRQGGARRATVSPGDAVHDHRVGKSLRLLRQSVGGERSLDAIAREVGLSRPHFFKLFRENVGVTPNVYLNTVRTERAIERLVGTEQAVTSIGLDLGFASQASFTRFFGANAGIPPTDYRRVAQRV